MTTTQTTEHELKTHPEPFAAILDGRKRFEVRKNDRDFRVGDELHLREWNKDKPYLSSPGGPINFGDYTGRKTRVRVTYLVPGGEWGLPADLCVMGIEPVAPPAGEDAVRAHVVAARAVIWNMSGPANRTTDGAWICRQEWERTIREHLDAAALLASTPAPAPATESLANRIREAAAAIESVAKAMPLGYVFDSGPFVGRPTYDHAMSHARLLRALLGEGEPPPEFRLIVEPAPPPPVLEPEHEGDRWATLVTEGEANGCYPCDTCRGYRAKGRPCQFCTAALAQRTTLAETAAPQPESLGMRAAAAFSSCPRGCSPAKVNHDCPACGGTCAVASPAAPEDPPAPATTPAMTCPQCQSTTVEPATRVPGFRCSSCGAVFRPAAHTETAPWPWLAHAIECCDAWEPAVRIIGNVPARALGDMLRALWPAPTPSDPTAPATTTPEEPDLAQAAAEGYEAGVRDALRGDAPAELIAALFAAPAPDVHTETAAERIEWCETCGEPAAAACSSEHRIVVRVPPPGYEREPASPSSTGSQEGGERVDPNTNGGES